MNIRIPCQRAKVVDEKKLFRNHLEFRNNSHELQTGFDCTKFEYFPIYSHFID